VIGKGAPLYLITFNTHLRRPLLAEDSVHLAFRDYAAGGERLGIAVGRYVLMPDHVHVFVRVAGGTSLGMWMRGLKRQLGKALAAQGHGPAEVPGQVMCSYWQPGFFDHLLRHDESYAKKWRYVWMNPVRAGLVSEPDAWPYEGEIVVIDRA